MTEKISPATAFFDANETKDPNSCKYVATWKRTDKHEVSIHTLLPSAMTSNQAEYRSLILVLEDIVADMDAGISLGTIRIHGDSKIVINQMKRKWRVKNSGLLILWAEAQGLKRYITANGVDLEFVWVPRKQNNKALGLKG